MSAMMLGFTSRTFHALIARGATTLEDVVAWASAERFPWVEVRDGNLALSEGTLKDLNAKAARGGVRLHYAWDGTNILDPADHALFLQGVKNARVLGEETFVRLTIAGRVIRDNPGRTGYTFTEFATLRQRIEGYIRTARERHVRLVFENSHEPVTATGRGEAGISELLSAIPTMELTFDPGNFMDKEHNRSSSGASDVKKLYQKYADRIPYVHVKMTRGNIVQPVLIEDGDVEADFYRRMLADGKLVCIELPDPARPEELDACKGRILDGRRLLESSR